MNKKLININFKSFLALILVSILMLSVASPVLATNTDNHKFTEKEEEYERIYPIQGDVLDFSELKLDSNKFATGATHVKGDVSTGSYSITKTGSDYTIHLQNVNISKLILPYDDADSIEVKAKNEEGDDVFYIEHAVKRDADGNFEERKTHITIKLSGTNEINGYGIEGHYVKGITIEGPGALNINTHLEPKLQNINNKVAEEETSNVEEKEVDTETVYYIVPGMSIETDSIEDKEDEKNTGFVFDNVHVTVTNPYYWGIICNGDIDVKNNSKIVVKSYEGIKKRAEAGDISTDKLFVDETSSVNASKILKFKAEEQVKQEKARERAKYKDDNQTPEIKIEDETETTEIEEDNGKIKIYCKQPKVTVTDDRKIDKITVNGEKITVFEEDTDTKKTFIVPSYLDCKKEVKAIDMKGNEKTFTFKSNSDHITKIQLLDKKEPTCTEDGYEEDLYKCLICGKDVRKEKVSLPALGHSFKVSNYSSYTEKKCTRCGYTEKTEVKKEEAKPLPKPQVSTPSPAPAATPKTVAPSNETKQEPKKEEVKEIKKVQVANTITASNFTKTYSTKAQSFSINAKRNGNAKLTYKSNNSNINVDKNSGKVTVKAKYVGKATITISSVATDDYKAATKTITVTVNPSSVKLSKLTNKKSKKMEIKWAKNTAVTGYQIQYSTDKNFKKSVKTVTVSKNKTVTKTVSKLSKNKKYYVRVRTYKTVSGTKYYSNWSNVKNIKIKK